MNEQDKITSTTPGRTVMLVNVFLFAAVLAAGGILSFVLPKSKISEYEKRELTHLPAFTFQKLFHAKFTDSLDLYYADNFPYRENFVSFSSALNEHFGYRVDDMKIYNLDRGHQPEENRIVTSTTKKTTDTKTTKDTVKTDTLTALKQMLDTMHNDGEFVNSILIYDGRGYQIFGGSSGAAHAYANMINAYHKVLGDSVTIHVLVIPSAIDYYLPSKYKGKASLEKPNIDLIYSFLSPGIQTADAFSEIEKHTSEYLYFHTDHHWTGLGAYYAYRAYCASAGFTPYELSQFTKKTKRKFLGSLYDLTRDSRLRENIDSVEYFLLPVNAKVTLYKDKELKNPIKSSLLVEMAGGANSYSVFLGGDYPLLKAVTENKNGKRILIIKDSFGNAISPFFALHYEEVYVIDYRYFESNLVDFIRKNKITDLIFLHNTFMANSKYTVQKESYLMKTHTPVITETKKDSLKKN
ncbi:MAG TPA: DHHW family protein [Bacteroidia bacterium]|jgi:hypothetical protein